MGDIPEGNMKNGTEENGIPENSVLVPEDKDAHKEECEVDKISFDDIIDNAGGFGSWQMIIFFMISSFDVFAAFSVMLPVFTGAVPDWYCTQYEGSNTTYQQNETTKSCERDGHKCVQFEFSDSFTSVVSQWNLVCDLDYVSDLVTTIQGIGLVVGAGLFGQLSDLLGRKFSYFLANSILLIGGFMSALVPCWGWYAAARFVVGVGFGANMVINCVYPLEFVGRQWRVLCGTIGFWSPALVVLPGLAYCFREWTHLIYMSTIPGILAFFSFIILPESPRWLNQHKKYGKAQEVLRKIAQKNKRPVPSIDVLREAARAHLQEVKHLKKFTYLDLFRYREYAKRTVILILMWFTAFLSYYMLSFNLKNLSGDRYLNMLYGGLMDVVAQVTPILFLSLIGRRGSLVLYLGTCLGCLIGILVTFANKGDQLPNVILGFALIGKSAGLGSTFVCQIFSAELYPTVIRNIGLGMSAVSARIAMISAPQFVYWATISRSGSYITLTALIVLCLPLTLLLPETKGRPLTDAYPPNQSDATPKTEMRLA